MTPAKTALALVLVLVSQGCYKYTPIGYSDLAPDMEVRAELTPTEREALADALPGDDRRVTGTVVDNGGDGLMLQVESVTSQRGVRLVTLDQRVHITQSGILLLEVREKDRPKTYGLTAAITAGIATVVILAIQAGRAGESDPLGGDRPQDILIPLLRIPTGR